MKGSALGYMEYEPLYDVEREGAKFHYVVCDSYVTMSDGTGIVHIAPAFGEDDARVGRKYNLPFVQLVDAQGCLTEETKWPGVFVKDADKLVLADLRERRLLIKAPKFEHDYPFCWRCDTPHQDDRRARRADAQQPRRQLDAGEHQGRPHGQLPG